jgi:hypothetical protein
LKSEVQQFFHGQQTLESDVSCLGEQPRALFGKASSFFYYRLDIFGR